MGKNVHTSLIRERIILKAVLIGILDFASIDDGCLINWSPHRPVDKSAIFKVNNFLLIKIALIPICANVEMSEKVDTKNVLIG
jgi:hypothetical protein